MVQGIRGSCSKNTTLDVHLCVERPERYIDVMKESGASRILFQIEAMDNLEKAIEFAQKVKQTGIQCGISINPSTPIEGIFEILVHKDNLVDLVDVLAVEPGFGGQTFQNISLNKIRTLRNFLDAHNLSSRMKILVDGGVNASTAAKIVEAGADILVAGTFLFQHPKGLGEGVTELRHIVKQAKQ